MALLAIKGNVTEVGQRDFRGCLSSEQPLSICPSEQREKLLPLSPTSRGLGTKSWSLARLNCVGLHPQLCRGSAPPRVQSRKTPARGRENLPEKSPKHRCPRAKEAPVYERHFVSVRVFGMKDNDDQFREGHFQVKILIQ